MLVPALPGEFAFTRPAIHSQHEGEGQFVSFPKRRQTFHRPPQFFLHHSDTNSRRPPLFVGDCIGAAVLGAGAALAGAGRGALAVSSARDFAADTAGCCSLIIIAAPFPASVSSLAGATVAALATANFTFGTSPEGVVLGVGVRWLEAAAGVAFSGAALTSTADASAF